MKYQLVQSIEGQGLVSEVFGPKVEIIAAMEIRGYAFRGIEAAKRLRPELQGQPQFVGLYGPCWGGLAEGGEPIIRYESPEAYAELSA